MAGYDPQRRHRRDEGADEGPAPVDELLGETAGEPAVEDPSPGGALPHDARGPSVRKSLDGGSKKAPGRKAATAKAVAKSATRKATVKKAGVKKAGAKKSAGASAAPVKPKPAAARRPAAPETTADLPDELPVRARPVPSAPPVPAAQSVAPEAAFVPENAPVPENAAASAPPLAPDQAAPARPPVPPAAPEAIAHRSSADRRVSLPVLAVLAALVVLLLVWWRRHAR